MEIDVERTDCKSEYINILGFPNGSLQETTPKSFSYPLFVKPIMVSCEVSKILQCHTGICCYQPQKIRTSLH